MKLVKPGRKLGDILEEHRRASPNPPHYDVEALRYKLNKPLEYKPNALGIPIDIYTIPLQSRD